MGNFPSLCYQKIGWLLKLEGDLFQDIRFLLWCGNYAYLCLIVVLRAYCDKMAVSARRVSKAVNSKRTNWEEDECWWYYNMLPLHQVFEIVGSQLNENDVRVLSCLLEETEPQPLHPLHPTLWSVDRSEEETDEEVTANFLTSWWENKQRRSRIDGQGVTESNGCGEGSFTPRSGVEFLFELERRGLCDESNLRYLMQLLRILTRHDLLPYVNMKKRRTVSPERYSCGSYSYDAEKQVDECLNSASRPEQDQWRAGVTPNKRKRATRKELQQNTNGRTCDNTHQERPAQNRVTCGKSTLRKSPRFFQKFSGLLFCFMV